LPELTDGIAETVVPMRRAFVPRALHGVVGWPTVCACNPPIWTLMALTGVPTTGVQICPFWCAASRPFAGDKRASRRRACGISRQLPDVRAGLAY
jgi:hypothetical protein